jgi:hypothetical protein
MGLGEILIMTLLTLVISLAGFLLIDDAKRHNHPRKRKTAHS